MCDENKTATAEPEKVAEVSPDVPPAPRLSKALFDAPAGAHEYFYTDLDVRLRREKNPLKDDELVPAVLWHIFQRLEMGLLEAWCSRQAYDFRPYETKSMSREEIQRALEKRCDPGKEDEEKWARAFTEIATFNMYGGHGLAYFRSDGRDKDIYEKFPDAYAISIACQHLSTYACQARGIPFEKLSDDKTYGLGCTAGNVDPAQRPAMAKGESFACASKYTTVAELCAVPLVPGDVVVFNPGGKTASNQGGGAHIGSVLRVAPGRIQWIDTGVLIGEDEKWPAEGGTGDHSWNVAGPDPSRKGQPRQVRSAGILVGWGKLIAPNDLAGMAAKVAKSRPLGYARLVLIDRSDPKNPVIRYASKLLHQRFPVSRLMWSVRALPVPNLEARWYVYLPMMAWAENLLNDDSLASTPLEHLGATTPAELFPTNVIRGLPDGTVTVYRKGKDGWLMNFDTRGPAEPPSDQMLPGIFPSVLWKGKLVPRTVGNWCWGKDLEWPDAKSWGVRYYHPPGAAKGVFDTEDTGINYFDNKG